MSHFRKFLFCAAAVVWLASPAFSAEQVLYVQSTKAKIMSMPSFKGKLVAEVGKGYKLVSSGKEGGWYKVRYGSYDGYVSSFLLSPNPPLEKQSVLKTDDTAERSSVRRRASTYTSAAAARGLAADDRRRLSKEDRSDYLALQQVESMVITDEDLQKFMKENR